MVVPGAIETSALLLLGPPLSFTLLTFTLIITKVISNGRRFTQAGKFGPLWGHVSRWVFAFLRLAIYCASVLESALAMTSKTWRFDDRGYVVYIAANLCGVVAVILGLVVYHCIEKQRLHKKYLLLMVGSWIVDGGVSIIRLFHVLQYPLCVCLAQVCLLLALALTQTAVDVIALCRQVR
jgi:hypothetical protein